MLKDILLFYENLLAPCGLGDLTFHISIECTEHDETGLTTSKVSVQKALKNSLYRDQIPESENVPLHQFLNIFILGTFLCT